MSGLLPHRTGTAEAVWVSGMEAPPQTVLRLECPVERVPYADGHGSVLMHECGRHAGNIWPCDRCGDPGDQENEAVRRFAPRPL